VGNLQAWAASRPGNPQPHIELARLAEEHGDLREAENQLIDALKLDPNNPRALVAIGQLREAAGDPGQAIANYSRSLAVDPRQPALAARVAALETSQAAAVRTAALPPPTPPADGSVAPSDASGTSWAPAR